MHFFPSDSLLFEDEKGQQLPPTRWGVWVMYINPDVTEKRFVRVLSGKGGKETSLRIPVRLLAEEKELSTSCQALIDTGAEICVIKKELVPPEIVRPAQKPLRLVDPNERRLEGGDTEVTLTMCVSGVKTGSDFKYELRIPTTFYIADIKDPLYR